MVLIRTHWPILLILVMGSILRFYNLGLIPGPVFDEVFYPAFALNYLKGETFLSVHPPLGSYLFTLSVQPALISLLRYVITVLSYDLNVADKRMRGIF